jgi:hypothetical protein
MTEKNILPNPDVTIEDLNSFINNTDAAQFRAFAEGIADGQRMSGLIHSDIVSNLDLMKIQNSRSDFARNGETFDTWAAGAMLGSFVVRKEVSNE